MAFNYTASGGTPPYTFSLLSGALPVGLVLNSNGSITGVATTAGDYSWVVKVIDSAGLTSALSDTNTVIALPVSGFVAFENDLTASGTTVLQSVAYSGTTTESPVNISSTSLLDGYRPWSISSANNGYDMVCRVTTDSQYLKLIRYNKSTNTWSQTANLTPNLPTTPDGTAYFTLRSVGFAREVAGDTAGSYVIAAGGSATNATLNSGQEPQPYRRINLLRWDGSSSTVTSIGGNWSTYYNGDFTSTYANNIGRTISASCIDVSQNGEKIAFIWKEGATSSNYTVAVAIFSKNTDGTFSDDQRFDLGYTNVPGAFAPSECRIKLAPDGSHVVVAFQISQDGLNYVRVLRTSDGVYLHMDAFDDDTYGEVGQDGCIDYSTDGRWLVIGTAAGAAANGVLRLYERVGDVYTLISADATSGVIPPMFAYFDAKFFHGGTKLIISGQNNFASTERTSHVFDVSNEGVLSLNPYLNVFTEASTGLYSYCCAAAPIEG